MIEDGPQVRHRMAHFLKSPWPESIKKQDHARALERVRVKLGESSSSRSFRT